MNLQHARIAALCEQLKLDRLPAEWPSVAQATIDNSGTHAD
ncbi:AAA family ATPase, partial [Candidatus Erwinia dacicola]|nr:AAA family ATPase [Candidatus Erwinia dacicola]